ncbi:MAG: decarboxylating 6-phosphogluconate dehydrogenase [Chloroflexi bacterium]|nr:decarboxylating 6-phosphogluconate dehydrogenase [Chloroflexota bacterium]
MEIGFVGLGRMGANMVQRLLRDGHRVVVWNRSAEPVRAAVEHGAIGTSTLEELVGRLEDRPRVIWVMLPAGPLVDEMLETLMGLASPQDILVDGGNSRYTDTLRRAEAVTRRGFEYVDAGTSGGIWGLRVGYCLMVGGQAEVVERLAPIFTSLAPENGWAHVGLNGAGHFSKMVHNGIEYGMMQSYAEGFEILERSPFGYDLEQLARVWNHGSVIRSWLLELAADAFQRDPKLEGIRGFVEDTGEGRWTVQTAIDEDVPAWAITAALFARFASRDENAFSARVLAALRREFGGHAIRPAEPAGGD